MEPRGTGLHWFVPTGGLYGKRLRLAALIAFKRYVCFNGPVPMFAMYLIFQNMNIAVRDSVVAFYLFLDQWQAEFLLLWHHCCYVRDMQIRINRAEDPLGNSEMNYMQWKYSTDLVNDHFLLNARPTHTRGVVRNYYYQDPKNAILAKVFPIEQQMIHCCLRMEPCPLPNMPRDQVLTNTYFQK